MTYQINLFKNCLGSCPVPKLQDKFLGNFVPISNACGDNGSHSQSSMQVESDQPHSQPRQLSCGGILVASTLEIARTHAEG